MRDAVIAVDAVTVDVDPTTSVTGAIRKRVAKRSVRSIREVFTDGRFMEEDSPMRCWLSTTYGKN